MFANCLSRFAAFLRPSIPLFLGAAAIVAIPSWADTRIKIASVRPEYTPTAGSEMPEAVSMQSFSFEVEPETGRARVVIDYTYPDQPAFGLDGGAGPEPTKAQILGLKYDAGAKTVVYDDGGKKTVCAMVRDRKTTFRKGLAVTPTGACVVTSRREEHVEDTGWSIRRSPAIDTFFEVR
jgi:hypothetical protein